MSSEGSQLAEDVVPWTEFTQAYYDANYFASRTGKLFVSRGKPEYWGYKNPDGEYFGAPPIAKAWKTVFEPKRVLDVGCGRGTFVAYLRDWGVEAHGFDYSEWAVGHLYGRCRPEWVRVHDATEPWPYPDSSFDLVTALDFFEHIYEEDLEFVIGELLRVSRRWIFLQMATVDGVTERGYALRRGERIPFEDGRTWAGHVTVQTPAYWMERFDRDPLSIRRDLVNWFCSLVPKDVLSNWAKNTMLVYERRW